MAEQYTAEKFSITPILNPETKEYSLLRFNEVMEACEGFIEENTISEINSIEDLQTLKKCRTNIRKKKDTIKSARLSLVKLFSWQFKALEDALGDADNQLKQIKEEFEATAKANQEQEVKVVDNLSEITLVIKSRDINIIENLKKLAVDNGCTVEEIKEK